MVNSYLYCGNNPAINIDSYGYGYCKIKRIHLQLTLDVIMAGLLIWSAPLLIPVLRTLFSYYLFKSPRLIVSAVFAIWDFLKLPIGKFVVSMIGLFINTYHLVLSSPGSLFAFFLDWIDRKFDGYVTFGVLSYGPMPKDAWVMP